VRQRVGCSSVQVHGYRTHSDVDLLRVAVLDLEDDDEEEVIFLSDSSQRPSDSDAKKRKAPLFAEPSPPTSPEASGSRPFKSKYRYPCTIQVV
jgi:hypothetical protein